MRQRHFPCASADPSGGGGAARDPFAALAGVLDEQAMARLKELDPRGEHGLLPRVLQAFDASLERLLAQLRDARSAGDNDSLRHVAHTLKSSSASVGAIELSRICADIERRIRERQTEAVPGLLDDMVAECDRVRAVLKPVLDTHR